MQMTGLCFKIDLETLEIKGILDTLDRRREDIQENRTMIYSGGESTEMEWEL